MFSEHDLHYKASVLQARPQLLVQLAKGDAEGDYGGHLPVEPVVQDLIELLLRPGSCGVCAQVVQGK